LLQVLASGTKGAHFLGFNQSGTQIWSANWEGAITLWNWRDTPGRLVTYRPQPRLSSMVALRDGRSFVAGTALGEVFFLSS
jgi:hypothetical protein